MASGLNFCGNTYSLQKLIETKNLKTKIILHGGLGNQLFQWAFGHRVGICGSEIEFIFYQRENNVSHAKTSLKEFLSNCQHGHFLESIKSQSKLKRVIQDPTFSRNLFRLFPSYILSTDTNPFLQVSSEIAAKKQFNFGYYQNWRLVEPIAGVIGPEIWQALNGRVKTKRETELYGSEVIHIRQNDIQSQDHKLKLGLLSEDYYQSLPKRTDLRRIVLTDDVKGAREVLKGLEIDEIFGPEQLDTYEALGVMANSTSLFTANSTLSWWGGFLAQSHGADVYIPDPFFRNFYPEQERPFAYPGFSLIDSRFMPPTDPN